MRAKAIEIMCKAANDTRDDPMCSQPKWEDFMEDMGAAIDALGAAGFKVLGPQYTDEMCRAGLKSYRDPLTAYDAIAADGDLTRLP